MQLAQKLTATLMPFNLPFRNANATGHTASRLWISSEMTGNYRRNLLTTQIYVIMYIVVVNGGRCAALYQNGALLLTDLIHRVPIKSHTLIRHDR